MTNKRNFNENDDKSLPKAEGLIIKATGGFYYVLSEGVVYECRARGVFRKRELSPLVGDRVTISVLPKEKGYIHAVHERKNSLVRPPLANIDRLVMVVSVAEPAPNLLVMDKLIAVAEHQDVEPVLVFTKCDLADPAPYAEIYRKAGFEVYEVCSTEHKGTEAVLKMLEGKVSAVWGTHTHVQTSDACVLPNGTGYITDLGMTGPINSVLGIDPMQSIGKFMGDPPRRYESAKGACMMEGCIFDIDPETGRCLNAEAIRLK